MNDLADAIEEKFYREGRREYLKERLSELTGRPKEQYNLMGLRELQQEYDELIEESEK
jgi:hypothetical protein